MRTEITGQLKKDTKARLHAIRAVILENPPTFSLHEITRTCIKKGIPTNPREVKEVRRQVGVKAAQVGATLPPLPPSVRAELVDAVNGGLDKVKLSMATRAALDETMGRTDAQIADRVYNAPPSPKLQLVALETQKLEEQMAERERRQRAKDARDAKKEAKDVDVVISKLVSGVSQRYTERLGEQPGQASAQPAQPAQPAQAQAAPVTPPATQPAPAAQPEQPSQLTKDLEVGRIDSYEGRAVRRRWLEDLLLQKPHLTSPELNELLRGTFGIGLSQDVVLESLRLARELSGLKYRGKTKPAPTPPAPAPAVQPAQTTPAPATKPEAPALLLLTGVLSASGEEETFEVYAAALDEQLTQLAQQGFTFEKMRVWRETRIKAAVKVVATVEYL